MPILLSKDLISSMLQDESKVCEIYHNLPWRQLLNYEKSNREKGKCEKIIREEKRSI